MSPLALALIAGCAAAQPSAADHRERAVKAAPRPAPAQAPEADGGVAPGADPAASSPRPAVRPFDPAPGMQMKEVSEKQWLASVRGKLAEKYKVDAAALHFAPSKQLVAFVREVERPVPRKPPRHPPPRRYQIFVVDPEGARRALFKPVGARGSDEPPRDFRFLSDDRLVYEVVQPPPALPPAAKKKAAPPRRSRASIRTERKAKGKPAAPLAIAARKMGWDPAVVPRRLFMIQPVPPAIGGQPGGRRRPIPCEGVRFAFNSRQDHLAFVGGKPEAAFVSVDGVQVFPRRGRTVIGSDLAWSKDGMSLAFLELLEKPRLVLLAQYDNATGDTTWELPAAAATHEDLRVSWASSGKLVVGKATMKPLFTASFIKEKPPEVKYKNAGP